jgi:hypothetical protein
MVQMVWFSSNCKKGKVKTMKWLNYIIFAVQARVGHKKYGVSPEYMEIALRIQYHRKRDNWSQKRYEQEMLALAMRYPEDVKRHMQYDERMKDDTATAKET